MRIRVTGVSCTAAYQLSVSPCYDEYAGRCALSPSRTDDALEVKTLSSGVKYYPLPLKLAKL